MERKYQSDEQAESVLKEALWLAWQAAGGPQGAGVLRDKPDADKAAVWENAYNRGDYSGRRLGDGANLYADYVFGRMLKLVVLRPSPDTLIFRDDVPRRDYQSWCCTYPTYDNLFDAAEQSVGAERLAS